MGPATKRLGLTTYCIVAEGRVGSLIVSGKRHQETRPGHRGWRGWRKHAVRRLRRLKPDDLRSRIAIGFICAAGLLGMYLAGTAGLYAVMVLMVVVAFAVGLATRGVKWVVHVTRSRTKES